MFEGERVSAQPWTSATKSPNLAVVVVGNRLMIAEFAHEALADAVAALLDDRFEPLSSFEVSVDACVARVVERLRSLR